MTNQMNTTTFEEMNAEALAWLEANDTTLPRREDGTIFWTLINLLERVEDPKVRARHMATTNAARERREHTAKVNEIAREQVKEFFATGAELTPIVDRQGNFLQ